MMKIFTFPVVICVLIFPAVIFIIFSTNTFHSSANTKKHSKYYKLTSDARGDKQLSFSNPLKVNLSQKYSSKSSLWIRDRPSSKLLEKVSGETKTFPSLDIPLVIVLCRSKILNADHHKNSWERQEQQVRTMFWSLLTFSKVHFWRVVVLVDTPSIFDAFLKVFSIWPESFRSRLRFEMLIFKEPSHYLVDSWRPCSWTKVFLADILLQFDTIVYSDTDMVFLGPAEDLWLEVSKLHDEKFLALGPEAWYGAETKENRTIAGKRGVNTGILLMNLTKSRELPFRFSKRILQEIKFTTKPRHDQDVINSFFSKNPQYLVELSPRFNFVISICAMNVTCKDCTSKGIVALHGADGSFYRDAEPRLQVSSMLTYLLTLQIHEKFIVF